VISTVALFLVLGGGSALALQGHNTVFSDDIVDGQVHKADIASNAVTSPKVRNAGLKPRDATNVAHRLVGGPTHTDDNPAGKALPLSGGGTWSQPTGEVQLLSGSAVVRRPQTCTTDISHAGAVQLEISEDGGSSTPVFAVPGQVAPGATLKVPLRAFPEMFAAPLASTNHTLAVKIRDSCRDPNQNWTVQSVRFDVVGLR
jgi:hypothetical protein